MTGQRQIRSILAMLNMEAISIPPNLTVLKFKKKMRDICTITISNPFITCAAVRPQSETCQVTENIAQYLNYFFGSVLKLNFNMFSPDCIPSTSCNDIICHLAQGGYYQYSLLVCETPTAVRLVNVLPNGTEFFERVTNHSEIFPMPPIPTITLNITFREISASRVGFGVSREMLSSLIPRLSLCTVCD